MGQVLHGSATTTEVVRRAIQHSQESLRALARRHGVNQKTIAKWRKRRSTADLPTGPKDPRSTSLSIEDEAVVVAFRRHTLLPLDDCLYALQATIPHLTRSSLHRCLQRHGISRLPDVGGDKPVRAKFKDYPIGYFHVDLAEVRTEQGKLYLLVAIDRTSKFAFVELHEKATRRIAGDFLRHLAAAVPYLAHVKTYQRSYATTEQYMRVHVLPRWRSTRLSAIRQEDVAAWLAEKGEALAPATVEKIRVVFGHSLTLAIRWGTPGLSANPVAGIARQPLNNAVERFLSADEAERLLAAAGRSRNTQLASIVGLLLLTGAREGELLRAEWGHVDLERQAWRIPLTKSGRARHVPLSQAAVDLIASLPRFAGCPYLVPNPQTLRPFAQIHHSWDVARRRAGLPSLRVHDLRHSAASAMVNAGVDLYAVGRVLGHASHKTTMRYAHLSDDTLRAAVEAGSRNLRLDAAAWPCRPARWPHAGARVRVHLLHAFRLE